MNVEVIITLIIAGFVAIQHLKSNQIREDELKFALFDKRFKVYEAMKKLLYSVMREGRVKSDEFKIFSVDSSAAHFLFGDELGKYIQEVKDRCVNNMSLHGRLDIDSKLSQEKREEIAKKLEESEVWFSEQLDQYTKKFVSEMSIKLGSYTSG